MDKITRTYSIKPVTYERIKKLAEQDNRSASSYIDILIEREYKAIFAPEYEAEKTETPARE
jgi:predicted DNA-binding protein